MRNWLFILALCAIYTAAHAGEIGKAALYSDYSEGSRTMSGERYDKFGLTAAHRSLPFGTRITVKNQSNGKTVTVRINDRSVVGSNIIKLSHAAARA